MTFNKHKVVDVIIPNYNETVRLIRAIESAQQQSPYINNIFIIDDGSSENKKNFLKTNIIKYKEVKLLECNRTGIPGVMRKVGIEKSQANWIAFLDADDWWEPKKIKKQLDFAIKNDAEFIATNGYIFKNNEKKGRKFFKQLKIKYNFNQIVKNNFIINSSVLISKKLLDSIGVYADAPQVKAVEDYATWLRILTMTDVHLVPEYLTNYSDDDNSIRKHIHIDQKIYAYLDYLDWTKHDFKSFKKRLVVALQIIKQIISENLIR